MYLCHQRSSSLIVLPFGMSWVQVQGSTFRGVADTGSPFLLVAACVGAGAAQKLRGMNCRVCISVWYFAIAMECHRCIKFNAIV